MSKKVIIRRPEVTQRTGLPKSSIYALMRDGHFPEPVKLSPRAVGWYEDLVDEWITSRRPRSEVA
jgi:prophage regulatory protein